MITTIIRSRKTKNRQYNDQQKEQNRLALVDKTLHKQHKDWAMRI
jgi:hypothetical protein